MVNVIFGSAVLARHSAIRKLSVDQGDKIGTFHSI